MHFCKTYSDQTYLRQLSKANPLGGISLAISVVILMKENVEKLLKNYFFAENEITNA